MSFNLIGTFNLALRIQAKDVTYYQLSTNTEVTISVSPSNYFRNHALIEEMTSEGREFILSKEIMDLSTITGPPKKGDRIIHSDLGNFTIREIRELLILGDIAGYRLRCD